MPLYLINGDKQQVDFQNDRTSILSYPAFPGGQVRTYRNEKATLLIKEILSDLFSISYKIFQFLKRQKLKLWLKQLDSVTGNATK